MSSQTGVALRKPLAAARGHGTNSQSMVSTAAWAVVGEGFISLRVKIRMAVGERG
jgi:hypothetical protein